MKVSVALCTFNGARFLRQQLDSILNQTRPVDEIIIGDDRSSDSTIDIINEYQSKHPKLIWLEINDKGLGSFKNFEKTIKRCKGEYIFLADQDDIWLPAKVQIMTEVFKANPQVEACFGDAELIDENSNSLQATMWESLGVKNKDKFVADSSSLFKYMLMNDNVVTGAALALRTTALSKIIPFEKKRNHEQHDQVIAFRLASDNAIMPVNEIIMKYRIHSNQQVGTVPREYWTYTKELKYNIWHLGYLSMDLEVSIYEAWKYLERAKLYCNKPFLNTYIEEARQTFSEVKRAYLNRLSFFRRKKVLYHWYNRSEFDTSLIQIIIN